MADAIRNPDSLKELKALEVTGDLTSFVTSLAQDVAFERTNRATWEQYIDRFRNIRYGIRNIKTIPWPNCANYVLGLVDDHITQLKPHYLNLAFAVSPICVFEPFGPEDVDPARKRELLFDWRMRTQVKFFDQYTYGIDRVLGDGAVVFKVIWRFETGTYARVLDLEDFSDEALRVLFDVKASDDMLFALLHEEVQCDLDLEKNVKEIRRAVREFRDGKTRFELTLHEVKHDRPQVIARDLREDVVLPIYTVLYEDNIDNARFIDDSVWTTKNEILQAMRDGKYREFSEDQVGAWIGKSLNDRKYVAGAQSRSDDSILLHEVCCWYDVNDDKIKERCIVTYPDANPASVLRFIELPYDHGQWPYTLVKRELNDPTVYSSRGIGAIDEDYQVGISTAFNQAIDNGTIVNTPKVVYKRGAISNLRNARYIPGESVEIISGSLADYEVRQQLNMSQGTLFQQAQFLRGWADQRIGDLKGALSSPTNLPGAGTGGQRTKAEVNLMANVMGGPQAMDLLVFQMQMARVYAQIDALYDQFGSEEEYALIMNERPVKMTRKEIQGKFNIVPNGRLDNSSPMLRAQKAFNLMRIFAGDPDVKQYELKRLFLNDYDPRISARILLSTEDMAKRDAQSVQEQEETKQLLKQEMAEVQELRNALEVKKEVAISVIHGRKYAPDAEREPREAR